MNECRRDCGMTPCRASIRIMATDSGSAGGHVAGVLFVAGRVGDDEFAFLSW